MKTTWFIIISTSSGFRGGGGGTSSGIRPSSDPNGPPFVLFWDIHFWLTDLKTFLKASVAPIYTNFEGERALKKRNFLVKFSKKCLKTPFFGLFHKFACCAENFVKLGSLYWLGKALTQKINLVDLKKKVDKIFKTFLKIRLPPREIPRSAPDINKGSRCFLLCQKIELLVWWVRQLWIVTSVMKLAFKPCK